VTLRERAERIVARCRELARISDVEGETTRTYLSPAMRRANETVAAWMKGVGMKPRMDAAGNLRGVAGPRVPRVVLGSHLDTVVNAGAFDGPLGVMLAIEAVSLCGEELPFGVEVIAFSEEEGVRFRTPFLGSRAVVGTLDAATLGLRDARGVSVEEAMREYGLNPEQIAGARLEEGAFAYLEVHIEQGPVLEGENRAIAAVSAIAGQTRLRVRFEGQANHAGTTPMFARRDALVAAAQWIGMVEAFAAGALTLVATVGEIAVEPGLGNVVPGVATASLDVRHADDGVREAAVERLLEKAKETGQRRGVAVSWQVSLEQAAVAMDGRLTGLLVECAQRVGYDARAIVSGAGHDAMIVAPYVPAAMLFVRTPGGVSHHPEETVRVEDVEAALEVTMEFLRRVGSESRPESGRVHA
jgi:allantoate deiminase